MQVDYGRLQILTQLQRFLNDASVPVMTIEVRSNGEERFVHTIAAQFMLGRASMRRSEKEEAAKGAGLFHSKLRVKVCKAHFYACSTIPMAERLSGGGRCCACSMRRRSPRAAAGGSTRAMM